MVRLQRLEDDLLLLRGRGLCVVVGLVDAVRPVLEGLQLVVVTEADAGLLPVGTYIRKRKLYMNQAPTNT